MDRRSAWDKYHDETGAAKLFVSGKARWEVGWLRTYPGATVPMWQFPLVYPYL